MGEKWFYEINILKFVCGVFNIVLIIIFVATIIESISDRYYIVLCSESANRIEY